MRLVFFVSQAQEKKDEFEEMPVQNKTRTLGGTLTLRRKKGEDNEPVEDPKMKTMRRNLQTEDGSKSCSF